jgi:nucleotide-binding universal stress UspA family protein
VIVSLRDGSRLEIRPIEPDDRTRLAEGFERLSPESRYRRFFGPMPELSERDLDYLVTVDHHDHEALLAVDPKTRDCIGVARYVRTGDAVAEAAVVVIDDWQGRGVGTHLLEALANRAREEGIVRFEAPVLANNREAIRVLERLGPVTRMRQGREVLMRIELPVEPERRRRWRTLLRQFASGTLEPARSLIELLWPRRPGAPDDVRRNTIVVGTDGSDHAVAAVQTAAALAAASKATIDLVGVHRFIPSDRDAVAAVVRDAASALREQGLHVHEHLRRGDPALVLSDVATEQNARLIVVGAGDRSKAARRIVGGVADSVALRSPCSVLIVRPREPAQPTRT